MTDARRVGADGLHSRETTGTDASMGGRLSRRSGPQALAEARQQPGWRGLWARIRPPTKSSVSISLEMLLLCAVVYGVLVFCIGNVFLPGGPGFATLLIWICSVVSAEIAHFLRVPRVVGMLGAGLLLANVPGGVVAAFPRRWGTQMRAAALATIFLRCGLELEFKTMALYKWSALRLAFIPGLAEALFDAGLCVAVFGMPFPLALALGFILKAVGPGLVVPAMFQLQKQGLGASKGIPSTVVIAASFDDIIAITGFSVFINIAVASGDHAAWMIASGPLQVVFGMVGGVIAGAVLGCTKLFDNRFKRLIGIYGAALLLMFFLEYYDMLSGGALGALTVGLATCYAWEHGWPRRLSSGPNNGYSADIERVSAAVWNWVMEPMLFATIGTSIVFSQLSSSTIPRALLVVCTGLALRTLVTGLVMGGRKYTWRERLFFAFAWTPKATVQASLASVPLALINANAKGHPDYEQWRQWGLDMLATGVFAIVVCATLGTLLIYWFAPVLLEPDDMAPPRTDVLTRSDSRGTLTKQHSIGASAATTAAAAAISHTLAHSDVDPVAMLHELREASDHTIINQYFDSIEKLVALVMEGRGTQAREEGLCETVLGLQEAIARDVGPQEMTVRQMLHSAALRSRQPAITAAAADQLVRLSLSDLGDPAALGSSPRFVPPGSAGGGSSGSGAGDVERGVALESVGSTNAPGGAPAAAGQHVRRPPAPRPRPSDPAAAAAAATARQGEGSGSDRSGGGGAGGAAAGADRGLQETPFRSAAQRLRRSDS